MLQRRLLGGKVLSDDNEKLMIAKLKTECGFQFTSKLEGMFNDLRASADFMEKFRLVRSGAASSSSAGTEEQQQGGSSSGSSAGSSSAGSRQRSEVDVTVLTKTNWPSSRFQPCLLPSEVLQPAEAFRTYYLSCHSGRRLEWYTEKGTADVIFTVAPGRRHELTVSTFQMAVLLLFNEQGLPPEGLSFASLIEATGVPAEELGRHVLSIANPKFRILNKASKVRAVRTRERSERARVRVLSEPLVCEPSPPYHCLNFSSLSPFLPPLSPAGPRGGAWRHAVSE